MRRLTVLMPFHTPFYAPLAGDIEISLGGLMRSFELADRSGPVVVHFAEVCSRNGFFLLGREAQPGFRWSHLVGKTVLSFAEAPTPWQCMLTVLRRHGVDPQTVRIERERPAADAVAAFRAGHGDFLEQPQPVVEQLIADGAAHLVASMGEATGPVPFTSYMTTPAFPETKPAILERAVARYHGQGTWARDPLLRREGYAYLEEILLAGAFIERRARYEDLVNTAVARQVMAAA